MTANVTQPPVVYDIVNFKLIVSTFAEFHIQLLTGLLVMSLILGMAVINNTNVAVATINVHIEANIRVLSIKARRVILCAFKDIAIPVMHIKNVKANIKISITPIADIVAEVEP
jgi:hypothetical protein